MYLFVFVRIKLHTTTSTLSTLPWRAHLFILDVLEDALLSICERFL